jgi:hypothetical protein
MNDVAHFEAYLYDEISGFKEWVGTADIQTIKKHGLAADLSYPLYGPKIPGGWGYKDPKFSNRFN